jgi:hypothetical protein
MRHGALFRRNGGLDTVVAPCYYQLEADFFDADYGNRRVRYFQSGTNVRLTKIQFVKAE